MWTAEVDEHGCKECFHEAAINAKGRRYAAVWTPSDGNGIIHIYR